MVSLCAGTLLALEATLVPVIAAEPVPVPVTFAQTPPAVQKTIMANIGAGKISSIGKEVEGVEISYDVELVINGQSRDLDVAEDGTLLKIEVMLAETLVPVQKTIAAQTAGGKLGSIEKTFEIDGVAYEVEFTGKDGAEGRFSVGEDGALLEIDVPLSAAPPQVQKTANEQAGNGTLSAVTKVFDDAKVSYEAEFTRDGKDLEITIAPDGKLTSERITLDATTPEARKTILGKVGNGKIVSVSKSYEKRDKVFPFTVEAIKDGKSFDFSVGPKGKFLGMDE